MQGGWLTFEHDNARRRLVPAPERWADAEEELLREWLGAATPVVMRIRDMDLPMEIPVVPDGARSGAAPMTVPPFAHDLRRLLERSRETIDTMNRAMTRTPEPVEEPAPVPDGAERE